MICFFLNVTCVPVVNVFNIARDALDGYRHRFLCLQRVVKKAPRKNKAANPPTLLPSDIIEDYDFNENSISKATRKTKPTTSCKSLCFTSYAKPRDFLLKEKERTLKNKQQDNKNKTRGRKRTNKQEKEVNSEHSDDDDEPALSGDTLRNSPVGQEAAISPSRAPATVSTPRHLAIPQINYELRRSTRRSGKHADDTRLPLENNPNEDGIGAVVRGGQTLNVGPITRSKTSPRKKKV
ncbi:unnamed protein product [Clavelina lepadiformis]|uniref:Uncharacterized protein n=1 Tax=Clavelina lepadiformis TaxID=159417 RepID=A0ABP0G9B5_CLALP